jgi:hypothetical protein
MSVGLVMLFVIAVSILTNLGRTIGERLREIGTIRYGQTFPPGGTWASSWKEVDSLLQASLGFFRAIRHRTSLRSRRTSASPSARAYSYSVKLSESVALPRAVLFTVALSYAGAEWRKNSLMA